MNKTIELNSIVQRKQDIISSQLDDETAMMSIELSKYFGVNDTGSRIWEIIEHPVSVMELVNQLSLEYEVDPKNCEEQVVAFLNALYKEKILQVDQ